MAEQVVVLLLDKIATNLIEGKAGSWWKKDLELRHQIEWIEEELRRMQCFIKDADSKQDGDERIKNWVADLREVAYDIDDILDSFVYRVAQGQQRGVLVTFFKRYCLFFNELISRRKVNNQIRRIRSRIQEISDSKSTYGIGNIGRGTEGSGFAASRLKEKRTSSVHVCEDIVGMVEDVRIIESQLIHGESRRAVISIVGMAGIGKTTLAKKAFVACEKHFDCCAWVYVSQDFRAKDILHEMGKKLMGHVRADVGSISNEDLRERISNFLENKRYLVVLDDIWNLEDWDDLKAAFPKEKNGSRVLLTTRFKDVALYADSKSFPHEVCLMNDEDSWKLFSKMVCSDWESSPSLPPWSEELGKQILRRCGGLPLAIVVLGGLLSRKDATFNEWQKVLESMHWQLRQEPMQFGEILALSYRDLPYHLKSCFLYLGLFPEDFEISARRLMLLWVAEGFVLPRGQEPLEDIAEDYLEELIGRNMVQVAERKSNGRIKSCRIHDLLRDISISIAKEHHFLDIIYGDVSADSLTRGRRLAIHSGVIFITKNTPKVRSLLCFDSINTNSKPRKLKLLRVLDLEGIYLTQLDSGIGNLIHLRYLSLRGTWLNRLPSTIGYLVKLQTLNLRSTLISPIPIAIWKLQNLRFLYFNELKEMVLDPPKDAALTHLQTLRGICISQKSRVEHGLDKLTDIRELELHGELYAQEVALAKWILMSKNLECLKLHANTTPGHLVDGHTTIQDFDRTHASIPKSVTFVDHFYLSKLHLEGFIKKLYDVEDFPPNLTELSLEGSYLTEDPMPKLEKLQNLRVLKLKQSAYYGKELVCSSGGFPQLRFLKLSFLSLQTWRIEEGSFCNLKQLEIIECKQMKILPRGLQPITSLKDLRLGYLPHEFALKVQEREGENWALPTSTTLSILTLLTAPIEASAITFPKEQIVSSLNQVETTIDQVQYVGSSVFDVVGKVIGTVVEVVKPGVEVALPILKQAGEQALKIASPVISEASKKAQEAIQSSGIDTEPVITAAKTVSDVAEQTTKVIEDAKPLASSTVETISSADPITVVGAGGALLLACLLLPPVFAAISFSLRGYMGDLTPAQTLDLMSTKSYILIDIRPEKDKEKAGIPRLPSSARNKIISILAVTNLGFKNSWIVADGFSGSKGWLQSSLGTDSYNVSFAEVLSPSRVITASARRFGTTGSAKLLPGRSD